MERLNQAIEQGHVLLDLPTTDMAGAIRETVLHLVSRGVLKEEHADKISSALMQRELDAPTSIGHAAAIPHTYLDGIEEQIVFFVRLAHPINEGALDGIPIRFLFFLLGPPGSAAQHLDTLAGIARLLSDDQLRYQLRKAHSGEDLLRALEQLRRRSVPEAEPEAEAADGLTYTGRFCGGLIQDIRRRLPYYRSDFIDGMNMKSLGSTLYLFFACLAPAVTFGGVMAVLTNGEIGMVERITALAICGVTYALISGQPLIILGGTGPMLIFTVILYQLCADLSIPFLPAYAWIGLWGMLYLLLLAALDASCLMRFFTRFTDEIFAALISMIFIYEAIKSLIHIFQDLDVKKHHDTALLSLLLALGTFYIAITLSRFRKSHYMRPWIREFLADFGPTIALASMAIVSVWLHEVFLDVLPAPDTFATTTGRPWLVDIWGGPSWLPLAAAVPALLLAVLMFLDQNITARIVNSADHKLQKGASYHLDLACVGTLMGFCSLFGMPWLVAATVRSLNHVRSLATTEEVVSPTGETRDKILFVHENRLTNLSIHLLIGLSLLLLPWLKSIPLAVLYGLFLYMGVVSISGNQFFERLSLWLRDPAMYPVTHYIRRVPRRTIHAFTLLQLNCLVILWVVKSSAIGILFPIIIALLVPVRMIAGKFFKQEYLDALDAEEEPDDDHLSLPG